LQCFRENIQAVPATQCGDVLSVVGSSDAVSASCLPSACKRAVYVTIASDPEERFPEGVLRWGLLFYESNCSRRDHSIGSAQVSCINFAGMFLMILKSFPKRIRLAL
jgi:hypothetical protein